MFQISKKVGTRITICKMNTDLLMLILFAKTITDSTALKKTIIVIRTAIGLISEIEIPDTISPIS